MLMALISEPLRRLARVWNIFTTTGVSLFTGVRRLHARSRRCQHCWIESVRCYYKYIVWCTNDCQTLSRFMRLFVTWYSDTAWLSVLGYDGGTTVKWPMLLRRVTMEYPELYVAIFNAVLSGPVSSTNWDFIPGAIFSRWWWCFIIYISAMFNFGGIKILETLAVGRLLLASTCAVLSEAFRKVSTVLLARNWTIPCEHSAARGVSIKCCLSH